MVLDLLLAAVRCSVVACQGEHEAAGAGWQAGKEEVMTVALGRWRSAVEGPPGSQVTFDRFHEFLDLLSSSRKRCLLRAQH